MKHRDIAKKVISDFGNEWSKFSFLENENKAELANQATLYFEPIKDFLESSTLITIADFGAGSGRWSEFLLPYSSKLIVVEPSLGAFMTLKKRFEGRERVVLMNQRIESCDISESSLDLAVSLGVIHHIPDPAAAVQSIYSKLKPGGQFLCYLYYDFENRSATYRNLWRVSNLLRIIITRLPKKLKLSICDVIAIFVYFPLVQFSKLMSFFGFETRNLPLNHYQSLPFMVMRNDALDRFGTRLEQRFSREQIRVLFAKAGFDPEKINFSEKEPFWTFSARKP